MQPINGPSNWPHKPPNSYVTTYVSVDKRFGPPTRYWTVLILLNVGRLRGLDGDDVIRINLLAHPPPRVSSAGRSSSPRRSYEWLQRPNPQPFFFTFPQSRLRSSKPRIWIQISWETACLRSRFDRSLRPWRLSCSSPREPPDRVCAQTSIFFSCLSRSDRSPKGYPWPLPATRFPRQIWALHSSDLGSPSGSVMRCVF